MANIDALNPEFTSKCKDSSHEWNICTKEELEKKDLNFINYQMMIALNFLKLYL